MSGRTISKSNVWVWNSIYEMYNDLELAEQQKLKSFNNNSNQDWGVS